MVFAADGNDTLDGGSVNDSLNGGNGNDSFLAGLGDDIINCDAGNDISYGGDGNDNAFGGVGDDKLFGDAGNDYLSGHAGLDPASSKASGHIRQDYLATGIIKTVSVFGLLCMLCYMCCWHNAILSDDLEARMAITPVSHQGYITQLFQPLATGKNQGADQATATDQLDGIINSVKQHSFKVPEWMQKTFGISAQVSDLGQLKGDFERGRLAQVINDLSGEIENNRQTGDFERVSVLQQQIQEYKDNPEMVSGFLVKGDKITGFILSNGLSAYSLDASENATTFWGHTDSQLKSENGLNTINGLSTNIFDKFIRV